MCLKEEMKKERSHKAGEKTAKEPPKTDRCNVGAVLLRGAWGGARSAQSESHARGHCSDDFCNTLIGRPPLGLTDGPPNGGPTAGSLTPRSPRQI
jgi:hypothetical protein